MNTTENIANEIADVLFETRRDAFSVEDAGIGSFTDVPGRLFTDDSMGWNLRVWSATDNGGEQVMLATVSSQGNNHTSFDFFADTDPKRVGRVLRARLTRNR